MRISFPQPGKFRSPIFPDTRISAILGVLVTLSLEPDFIPRADMLVILELVIVKLIEVPSTLTDLRFGYVSTPSKVILPEYKVVLRSVFVSDRDLREGVLKVQELQGAPPVPLITDR